MVLRKSRSASIFFRQMLRICVTFKKNYLSSQSSVSPNFQQTNGDCNGECALCTVQRFPPRASRVFGLKWHRTFSIQLVLQLGELFPGTWIKPRLAESHGTTLEENQLPANDSNGVWWWGSERLLSIHCFIFWSSVYSDMEIEVRTATRSGVWGVHFSIYSAFWMDRPTPHTHTMSLTWYNDARKRGRNLASKAKAATVVEI